METNSMLSQQIAEEYKAVVLSKLFDEYWPRLHQCLDECDPDLLWFRPNENTNSIGNLVIHLEGNVRQWVLHGVAGQEDRRNRHEEFDANRRILKDELNVRLKKLKEEVVAVVNAVSEEQLLEHRSIQGFETSVLGVLFHVAEHFSYHLGQITYLVKSVKNKDLGYYSDRKLE